MDFALVKPTNRIKETPAETVKKWLIERVQKKDFPVEFSATKLVQMYINNPEDDFFKFNGAIIPTLNGNLSTVLKELCCNFPASKKTKVKDNEVEELKQKILSEYGFVFNYHHRYGYTLEYATQTKPAAKKTKQSKTVNEAEK